jgi:hypothetical protein
MREEDIEKMKANRLGPDSHKVLEFYSKLIFLFSATPTLFLEEQICQ